MKKELPTKYKIVYEQVLPFLEGGRPGDVEHALEVARAVLEYGSKIDKIDFDVLVPVALMHDIGHYAILPEHFHYVTGGKKLPNGKLVHMLAGAKIARDILAKLNFSEEKSKEIVEIIAMHDMDQMKYGISDINDVFNTPNKRFFHDVDSLDRFSFKRLKKFEKLFPDKTLSEIMDYVVEQTTFFYPEIEEVAKMKLKEVKKQV